MAIRTRDRNAILVGAAASTLQGFLAMKQRQRDRAEKKAQDAQQQALFDQQQQLNQANIQQARGVAAQTQIETQRLREADAARRGIEGSKGFLGRQIDSTIDATFKARVDAQNEQFAKEELDAAKIKFEEGRLLGQQQDIKIGEGRLRGQALDLELGQARIDKLGREGSGVEAFMKLTEQTGRIGGGGSTLQQYNTRLGRAPDDIGTAAQVFDIMNGANSDGAPMTRADAENSLVATSAIQGVQQSGDLAGNVFTKTIPGSEANAGALAVNPALQSVFDDNVLFSPEQIANELAGQNLDVAQIQEAILAATGGGGGGSRAASGLRDLGGAISNLRFPEFLQGDVNLAANVASGVKQFVTPSPLNEAINRGVFGGGRTPGDTRSRRTVKDIREAINGLPKEQRLDAFSGAVYPGTEINQEVPDVISQTKGFSFTASLPGSRFDVPQLELPESVTPNQAAQSAVSQGLIGDNESQLFIENLYRELVSRGGFVSKVFRGEPGLRIGPTPSVAGPPVPLGPVGFPQSGPVLPPSPR